MKKIPTLFERVYENHKIIGIKDIITSGCEEAFKKGIATVKFDGSCCAIINGEFYKRYDCKKGKIPPIDAIPCCDPDPITGHWPHWVKVDETNPADKWFYEAYVHSGGNLLQDGTYEACGPHFQGNPYGLFFEELIKHGELLISIDRDFESIKEHLRNHKIEGIVFWLNGEPVCKIKRTDFGFEWPIKK
ncbi:MAG: hypothetical protein MR797_05645 [Lachnospiraceae bacterium]|nr:hypothetical protein [Lachnospiraceae bacterium]